MQNILNRKNKSYKILDWIILSFFVIFLLSLSNSIFVNQIGYFGALLFILIKAFLKRKNQFSKTGLELAFALYMLAEILALIFSDYKAQAFHFFTKRALLIPVVYTTIVVTSNLKRGKNFFVLFIVGSLITGIIYLVMSFQFYLNNLYNLTQSGPSLFQNPITASEIISFSVLFLFAFIINEKAELKTKIWLYAGFAISVLTLIATYKRTGWMGVAFGIVLILIIKKKWKILLPLAIVGIFLFITDKNLSQVDVYDFKGTEVNKLLSFSTDGRAYYATPVDSFLAVSDYENGLLFYKDSLLLKQIETPAPVVSFMKINTDLYLSQLIDTRFLIFKGEGKEIEQVNEILSPGQTKSYDYFDDVFYVLDSDSGLTCYESLTSEVIPIRFPELKWYRWLFIDSTYFYFISEFSGITIYSKEGSLPGRMIINEEFNGIKNVECFNGYLIVSTSYGLKLFTVGKEKLYLSDNINQITYVHRIRSEGDLLQVLSGNGSIYKIKVSANSKFEILAQDVLTPSPTNLVFTNNNLYCTYVKRGRLLSFLDPHLSVNFTRLALWRAGWEIFKDHPLFGIGDIGIEKYYVKYKRPYDKEVHGHLHNNYFHFLATLGLFGFLALMYLFFMIFKKLSGIYSLTKGKTFIASYSLGAIASFASILISGLSELNFWDQEIATLIYFAVGLNFALYINYKKEKDSTNEKQQ